MTGDILQRAKAVERRLSTLARSLYAAENTLDLAFVRSQRDVEGPTGQMASDLLRSLDDVWATYPLARDAVQQIGRSIARARWADADRLLRPDSITLPTGAATGADELLVALQQQLDQMVQGTTRFADRARRALSDLDATTATFAELVARATSLGAEHDVEIGEARRQVDRAVAAVAAEPTAEPAPQLELAMEQARQRVELLEQQRLLLPAALTSARSQLQEIRRLVKSGAEAFAETQAKITRPVGLGEPLDPSGLECGDRGLRPWLARIEDQAKTGRWQAAAASVEQWRKLADRWLTGAQHVLAANRAPLVRRNELRGLLQASQARAVAAGRAEEPRLIVLGGATEEALYVAPCDLVLAEQRLNAYRAALRSNPEGEGA